MKQKRMNSKEWATIQAEYEGGAGATELYEKYKIPVGTIRSRASREKWKPGSELRDRALKEAREKVEEEIKDTYTETVKEAHLRHLKTFKNSYIVAQQLLLEINEAWHERRAKHRKAVEEAKLRGLEPPARKVPLKEIYALNALTKTIYRLTEGERIMLGLDEFDPLEEREDPTDRLCQILEGIRTEYKALEN